MLPNRQEDDNSQISVIYNKFSRRIRDYSLDIDLYECIFFSNGVMAKFGNDMCSNYELIIPGWSNLYEGTALCAYEDVVFVSITYRCGIFGRGAVLNALRLLTFVTDIIITVITTDKL